ncbi:hypothetical protein [Microbacterium candidum]|uniref:Yip1 domain-containing protein n=1 Tax=Microbacterium candidum TaxID=3041922 RepID=A0ABT7N2C3_9MICO|nr:hypothetical protein [Microbacterium sp. ASV49]MDL9980821.1 hypothetical protein [Microbacterium sp. ASV49]
MSDADLHITPRVGRILTSEEAIYGLILVSGMLAVSAAAKETAWDTLAVVVVTVVVFFAAHVYAGTLGRLAATSGHAGVKASLGAAASHSVGMVYASLPAIIFLVLGATRAIDDVLAEWAALIANTIMLGVLGWIAVAGWTKHWAPRILSALVTAAFGGILILLKAVVTH